MCLFSVFVLMDGTQYIIDIKKEFQIHVALSVLDWINRPPLQYNTIILIVPYRVTFYIGFSTIYIYAQYMLK